MAKATYQETDGTTRLRCCGQPPGSSMCVCDEPVLTAEQRQRNAAMKVVKAGEDHEFRVGSSTEAPDPYAAAIAAKRAARGLPALPEQRPAAPVSTRTFPLKPLPAGDGYAARISALRKQRGLERTSLPSDYRPEVPPDPYAATLTALRAEVA